MIHQVYDVSNYHSPKHNDLQRFLKELPRKSSVLVVGCGKGRVNQEISEEGFSVIGIDKDGEQIKSANNWLLSLEFRQINVLEMAGKFEEGQFSGVWLGGFFANMKEGEKNLALENIKGVMGRNGALYLTFSPEQKGALISLVEQAGFKVLSQDNKSLTCRLFELK